MWFATADFVSPLRSSPRWSALAKALNLPPQVFSERRRGGVDQSTGTSHGTATPIMPAGAIEQISSGQTGLTSSSTGTLLSTPADFTDARVVSVGRDGAALALDLPSGRY